MSYLLIKITSKMQKMLFYIYKASIFKIIKFIEKKKVKI